MKDITVREYSQLKDNRDYELLLECMRPKNLFCYREMNINTMPYSNVRYCIKLLQGLKSWEQAQQAFNICYGVSEKEFYNARVTEYFPARAYMIQEFERIVRTESKVFTSNNPDSALWEMAGAENLKRYEDVLPLIQLGKMFGMNPFDVGRKPYSEVFTLLAATKVQSDVENEFTKLKYKK